MNPAPFLDKDRLTAVHEDWTRQCGKRLRARRIELGWSQEKLAALVDVSAGAICKFELGVIVPKDKLKLALAHALQCEVVAVWPPVERAFVHAVAAA